MLKAQPNSEDMQLLKGGISFHYNYYTAVPLKSLPLTLNNWQRINIKGHLESLRGGSFIIASIP